MARLPMSLLHSRKRSEKVQATRRRSAGGESEGEGEGVKDDDGKTVMVTATVWKTTVLRISLGPWCAY